MTVVLSNKPNAQHPHTTCPDPFSGLPSPTSQRYNQSLAKSVSEPTRKEEKKHESTTPYIMHGFLSSATTIHETVVRHAKKELTPQTTCCSPGTFQASRMCFLSGIRFTPHSVLSLRNGNCIPGRTYTECW
jgi:hypothetical protein